MKNQSLWARFRSSRPLPSILILYILCYRPPEEIEAYYTLTVLCYGHVKYLSNKTNQSSPSCLWPEIFSRKCAKFFVARVLLNTPTFLCWYISQKWIVLTIKVFCLADRKKKKGPPYFAGRNSDLNLCKLNTTYISCAFVSSYLARLSYTTTFELGCPLSLQYITIT